MATAATTDTLDALARDVYPMGSKIMKQFNEGTPALDLIETTEKVPFMGKSEGRRLYIPTHTGPNGNAAIGVAEEGGLPVGSVNAMDKLTYNIASHFTSMKYTGLLEDTQGGGDQSVEDWVPGEMRRQQANSRRKIGWLLHGDGSGLIGALASAGNSGTTLRFAANTILDLMVADSTGKRSSQIILRGLTTGTRDSGQTALKALNVLTKTGSGGATPQITVQHEDGTSYAASAADLHTTGAYYYDSQGSSLIGFGAYCSDGNPNTWGGGSPLLGGVDRTAADSDWWQAYRLDADVNSAGSAQPLDLILHVQAVLDKINERAGQELGGDDSLLGFLRYSNWRSIGNQLSRDLRTMTPVKTLQGGFSDKPRKYPVLEYENLNFVLDRDAPKDKVRIINRDKARRYMLRPWSWLQKTGSTWRMDTAADGREADTYKATLITRQQMIFLSCLANAEIYNLSASN